MNRTPVKKFRQFQQELLTPVSNNKRAMLNVTILGPLHDRFTRIGFTLAIVLSGYRSICGAADDKSAILSSNASGVAISNHLTNNGSAPINARGAEVGKAKQRQAPLPNWDDTIGLPQPLGFNFYESNKRYPNYLLCTYEVGENHYDQSNEGGWFNSALTQIRAYGARRFPKVDWIVVVIRNVADHHGAGSFDQSYRAGAVFDAKNVFDRERDLSSDIPRAVVDRHPVEHEISTGQRWRIVEKHIASIPKRP
jgi:hypothetical protein